MKGDYRILVHDVVKKQKMLHKIMKMSYKNLPPNYQIEAGELLRGWEEQVARWHQPFSEMLNCEITMEEENEELNVTHGHNSSISRETPTEAEIRKAVKQQL